MFPFVKNQSKWLQKLWTTLGNKDGKCKRVTRHHKVTLELSKMVALTFFPFTNAHPFLSTFLFTLDTLFSLNKANKT